MYLEFQSLIGKVQRDIVGDADAYSWFQSLIGKVQLKAASTNTTVLGFNPL